jgi:hypothetical protein
VLLDKILSFSEQFWLETEVRRQLHPGSIQNFASPSAC